jgi:fructose-bisphosphate aldolase class II
MMDGSLLEDAKTPSDYAYNVEVTRRVVDMAHACGVSVEGELGVLGYPGDPGAGKEDGVGAEGRLTREQMLTDPDQAAAFVAETGVDALAIAIGTSHGAYKFTRPPTGEVLAIDRIREIHRRVPDVHLVMHAPRRCPRSGWGHKRPWRGPGNGLRRAGGRDPGRIRNGVRKVNIDTDLRLAATGAVRRHLAENPANFDFRRFLAAAATAMKELCRDRFLAFGSAGWGRAHNAPVPRFMADVYAMSPGR